MDNTNLLLGVVETVLGKGKRTSGNNYAFHCPFCNHNKPKLEVNLSINEKGENNWACWVCRSVNKSRGRSLAVLFKRAGASKEKISELKPYIKVIPSFGEEKEERYEIELPKEYKSLENARGNSITLKQARAYIKHRKISEEDIIKYKIGYCETGKYANSVIVQSFDSNGKLNYFVGRSFEKEPIRKYNAPRCNKHDIIGLEYYVNWKCPVILCEGIFDAIAIRRNAVPLFGKSIPRALMMKLVQADVRTVYIALDEDALKDALKHAEDLIKYGKEVYLVELEGRDPSDIGFEKMTKLLHEATPLTLGDLFIKKIELC